MTDETQAAPAVDPDYAAFLAFKDQKAAEAKAAEPKSWYVHLANGDVVTLSQEDSDANPSHYDGVQVIARYEVGA